MNLSRFIAVALILILAISPAFAAVCATNCASASLATPLNSSSAQRQSEHCRMMKMADSHHTNQHQQSSDNSNSHKGCGMAGCHLVQITPLATSATLSFDNTSQLVLTSYNVFGISAELLPPIKPPA